MSEQREKTRLQAFLASCGLGSRRSCEKLILDGRVSINTEVATLGQSVSPGDLVRFDGHIVKPQARLRYIALNKPPGFVTSMSDEKGRPVASSLLGNSVEERVYNIGRLDQWSSGLLLFTNDGDLTALMVHPSGLIEKEYRVETDLPIPPTFAAQFMAGILIAGIRYKAESVRVISDRTMSVVLIEGKNREIRRVLEHFELRAMLLRRTRIGPIELGDLAEGAHRELAQEEVSALRSFSASKRIARGRSL